MADPNHIPAPAASAPADLGLVLEEIREMRKEIAELKDQAATRQQVAGLGTALAIIIAAKAGVLP